MAKYKSLQPHPVFVDVQGAWVKVEPGAVVDFPAAWLAERYLQVGEYGEPVLWEKVEQPSKADVIKKEAK